MRQYEVASVPPTISQYTCRIGNDLARRILLCLKVRMSTQKIIDNAMQKYSQIMKSDEVTVASEEVRQLIDTSRMYLAMVLRWETSGEISRKEARKARVDLRNKAKSLLNKSKSLEEEVQQALKEFILEQPEYLLGKLKITEDFFSLNIKNLSRDLACFMHRPYLSFLEVGSFEGLSACWLLKKILTNNSCVLTCIDTFDFAGQGAVHLKDVGFESMSIEERFDHNVKQSGGSHKVRKIVGPSGTVLRSLTFSSYDFIYIDGSHNAVNVLEDAVLAWPLLKKGGLLTFDDYGWSGNPDPINRPKIAIDSFLAIFRKYHRLIRKDYQVTIEKLSD
jgi:predicted O-methyltransferase YrrM